MVQGAESLEGLMFLYIRSLLALLAGLFWLDLGKERGARRRAAHLLWRRDAAEHVLFATCSVLCV